MIPKLKPKTETKVPALHPQWANVDLAEILSLPSAYLPIGYANSTLSEFGAQAGERLWERGRAPGGSIRNSIRMIRAWRETGMPIIWSKYEIFRQRYPQTAMDKSQYDYWAKGKEGWTDEQKRRDCAPVAEIEELMRPEDETVFYTSLGNIFLGTMLTQHLAAWGVRTLLLSGYHLDWCIEQAARTARDMGYMPIVVGDACGCGREEDDAPTLERLNMFFAPVISTDAAIELVREGARRRQARGA